MTQLTLTHPDRSHVVVITDSDALTDDWSTEEERRYADSLPLPQRRIEFLASRIAARQAAVRLFGAKPEEITLDRSERQPTIAVAGSRQYVSYSHTHGIGAAAVDSAPIGVDLERSRIVSPRMAKFFLTDRERDEALESPLLHPLIHCWSAKEAAFKMFGTATLLSEISIVLASARSDHATFTCSLGDRHGRVTTCAEGGDYVLGVSRIVSLSDTV
jgi:phosphopantetheinyl transferase